jgi:prepilin-type processing-associated H-X9-DG protein
MSGADAERRPGSCVPSGVTDRRASGVLVVDWADGTCSVLPHGWLRLHCRCAACVRAARDGAPEPEPAALAAIRPVSGQGLNLVFADGHDRGIYPWAYLRALGEACGHTGGNSPTVASALT